MMDKRRAFGEELAGRRTEKGVSLEEMARVTKVRKPILEALESGRLEDLPPEVFTVGFLKVYASYLGINPAVVVSQYKRLTEPPVPAAQAPKPALEAGSWIRVAGVVAALIALAGMTAWLWWSYQEGRWPFSASHTVATAPETAGGEPEPTPKSPPAPDQSPAGPSGAPQGTGGGEAPAGSQAVPPSSPSNAALPPPPASASNEPGQATPVPAVAAAPAPSAPAPKGDVVLTCSESCWLEMWADGKRVVYRQVAPGEQLAFNGQAFRFNIGNASGLQVTWRGRPVTLPQKPGHVVKDFVLPARAEGVPAP